MAEVRNRENDLVLMPRQSALIKDMTKGFVTVCVGPFKTSLSDTDRLQSRDTTTGALRDARGQDDAIQPYTDVAEGDYVVLSNPTADKIVWPEPKRSNDMLDLAMGRKVNLPGPLSFPLWPFQTVKLITGHQLQTNQYLIARVINEEEATKNWDRAIVKTQTEDAKMLLTRPKNMAVGQLLIIKGTEVSFYIPPTGLEVVADVAGNYVREAVTLEQLEYCVLVNQNGDKRYERGPKVVFPSPSETFVESADSQDCAHRKFKAIELTAISGIHIKVTATYQEETPGNGKIEHPEGEELFITGSVQPIYFPRAEHAIIKYDGRSTHFATAVPKGEGRYVLDRFSGSVDLVRGPTMLLPDPRNKVLAKRIIPEKYVKLWFPGNQEALRVNQDLMTQATNAGTASGNYVPSSYNVAMHSTSSNVLIGMDSFSKRSDTAAPSKFTGDEMSRGVAYTSPRQITLNTKYEGAVSIDVWTGYAVLVVDRSGNRQVVQGPKTVLLEFDQSLAYLRLSTGKPKTTDALYETAYLQVLNNPVSDIIVVETKDAFQAKVKVSYRVSFVGDSEKWFNVENYIKLLCDHTRSMIRNAVKKVGLQEFNDRYIELVRDTVLGARPAANEGEPRKARSGFSIEENGMMVNDVEVLGLTIDNSTIASLLTAAQQDLVKNTLQISQSHQVLAMTKVQEQVNQEKDALTSATAVKRLRLEQDKVEAELELNIARLSAKQQQAETQLEVRTAEEKVEDLTASSKLSREKAISGAQLENKTKEIELEIARMVASTKELVDRAGAIKPDLIAALQAFGDKATAQKMAEAMAPLAILGGGSVADVVAKMFKGSGLESVLAAVSAGLATRSLAPVLNGPARPAGLTAEA